MLKAPINFRETILLLGQMEAKADIERLIDRIEWSGVSRRQLCHAFLDRPPMGAGEAVEGPDFDPRAAALELFQGLSFRDSIAPRLLRAFPGKRRLLFVHIPKAAGTDFMTAMRKKYAHANRALEVPNLLSIPRMTEQLQRFGRTVQGSDTIFMGGHVSLSWFLDEKLYRFNDKVAAIVRHPYEICVSLANYIVNRFNTVPDLAAHDVTGWARIMRMDAAEIAAMDNRVLALALVTRPGILPVNPICTLLGDGTARGTLETISRVPIEITDIGRYSTWLRTKWGIERTARGNVSPHLIEWSDLSAWQQGLVKQSCSEDIVIYDAIMARLQRTDTLSLTGPELVKECIRFFDAEKAEAPPAGA